MYWSNISITSCLHPIKCLDLMVANSFVKKKKCKLKMKIKVTEIISIIHSKKVRFKMRKIQRVAYNINRNEN